MEVRHSPAPWPGAHLVLQVEQGGQHGPSHLTEGGRGGRKGPGACSFCKCIRLSIQAGDGDGPVGRWEDPGKGEVCSKMYRTAGIYSVQVPWVSGKGNTVSEASKILGLRCHLLPPSLNEVVSRVVH